MSNTEKVITAAASITGIVTIAGLAYSGLPINKMQCAVRNPEELSAQLQTQIDNVIWDAPRQVIVVDTRSDTINAVEWDNIPESCEKHGHIEEDEIFLVWEMRRW